VDSAWITRDKPSNKNRIVIEGPTARQKKEANEGGKPKAKDAENSPARAGAKAKTRTTDIENPGEKEGVERKKGLEKDAAVNNAPQS